MGAAVRELQIVRWGLPGGPIDYDAAWQRQREVHADVAAGVAPDTVLLLEHLSVYTAGRRTQVHERPLDGTPVTDVDRGGKITWHGPGQLVGYPIWRLGEPLDVVGFVRGLEQALIDTLGTLGVEAGRIPGRSGVWIGDAKVAAIGVRVSRGVTMHGFALNVDCDLSAFGHIVPCGIADADVTSLRQQGVPGITVMDVLPALEQSLRDLHCGVGSP